MEEMGFTHRQKLMRSALKPSRLKRPWRVSFCPSDGLFPLSRQRLHYLPLSPVEEAAVFPSSVEDYRRGPRKKYAARPRMDRPLPATQAVAESSGQAPEASSDPLAPAPSTSGAIPKGDTQGRADAPDQLVESDAQWAQANAGPAYGEWPAVWSAPSGTRHPSMHAPQPTANETGISGHSDGVFGARSARTVIHRDEGPPTPRSGECTSLRKWPRDVYPHS